MIKIWTGKHAALGKKSKDWSARSQDNVSEWGDMSIRGTVVSVREHYKNPTKRVGLEQSGLTTISLKINLFSSWFSWKIVEKHMSYSFSLFISRKDKESLVFKRELNFKLHVAYNS
jgi:hypothetical protein